MTALNDGQPVWSSVEHLLADLWAVLVKAHSEKDSLPDDFDHPVRAEMVTKARAASKAALKELYLKRKREYAAGKHP